MADEVLLALSRVLEARKSATEEGSYVAALYARGVDAILKKVGEEATETVMAAKDGVPEKLVHEVADLWFHTLVLLASQGLSAADVLAELSRRMGVSGLEEKARRGAAATFSPAAANNERERAGMAPPATDDGGRS